jgi:hypothetical protein
MGNGLSPPSIASTASRLNSSGGVGLGWRLRTWSLRFEGDLFHMQEIRIVE